MFYLPTRFNVIYSAAQATTGTNILVPRTGKTKIAQAKFEDITRASKNYPHLNLAMHDLRTNQFNCNNFTPEESAALPKDHVVRGVSHCVYSRVTPLFFYSARFGVIPYAEYAYLLNVLIAVHSKNMNWSVLYKWFRMYDLSVDIVTEASGHYVYILRNGSVVHRISTYTIDKLLAGMLIESGLVSSVEEILSRQGGLSQLKITHIVKKLMEGSELAGIIRF